MTTTLIFKSSFNIKELNSNEISQVSGALGSILTQLGMKDFGKFIGWLIDGGVDIYNSPNPPGGNKSCGIKQDFLDFAKERN